jgi:peptidoglycan/xylan/chitin deacetylase (PgdA/CDA1 family)
LPVISYTVQSGDTVYRIARRFGVDPQKTIDLNKLSNPDLLQPGQELQIELPEAGPGEPPLGYRYYLLQMGDTLYGVAHKLRMPLDVLLALNPLLDPDLLTPGQRLLVPASAVEPAPPGYIRYVAQPGDSVYRLAKRYRTTMGAIATANNLADPDQIEVGQALLIPVRAEALYRGQPDKRMVSLTFDATYGDNQVAQILSVLQEHDIPATFFLSGIWAGNYPAQARAIAAAGHEIANHSFSHPHLTELSVPQMRDQIRRAERAMADVIGCNPARFFRPPFGEYNQELLRVAVQLGYMTIMWTVDSLDWQNPGAVRERVLAGARNGAIIRMHQGAGQTPFALPGIIHGLRKQGFSFGTVTAVLDP